MCRKSVWRCLFVYRDTSWWMTAEISSLIDIHKTFFDGKDVWWCLCQVIPGMLHWTHANHQVMLYGYHYYFHRSDSQNADFALCVLITHTNLDINNTACLHVVHNLEHPTSRLKTKSSQYTRVNAPKNNLSPIPVGKYGKPTTHSTGRHYQANEDTSGLEADTVRALEALCSLRSNKKHLAENRWATHLLSSNEKE